jgi:hypothetical protein
MICLHFDFDGDRDGLILMEVEVDDDFLHLNACCTSHVISKLTGGMATTFTTSNKIDNVPSCHS